MRESDTRLIPYEAAEIAWARARPAPDRVPLPALGDTVLYRHEPWGPVTEATVIGIEDLDDRTRPNLWEVVRDPATGRIVCTPDHVPIARPLDDPWPVLTLDTRYGVGLTQEARLRGSAGWLPLDWETRHRPLPDVLIVGG